MLPCPLGWLPTLARVQEPTPTLQVFAPTEKGVKIKRMATLGMHLEFNHAQTQF